MEIPHNGMDRVGRLRPIRRCHFSLPSRGSQPPVIAEAISSSAARDSTDSDGARPRQPLRCLFCLP